MTILIFIYAVFAIGILELFAHGMISISPAYQAILFIWIAAWGICVLFFGRKRR